MKPAVPKKPGAFESRLSVAILALLAITAAGICLRQFTIHPAVLALRPESQRALLPASGQSAAVIDPVDSGIAPFSAPERFGPDTLYEKIDGRADLYLSAGFVSLTTQRFTAQASGGDWVEVFVYDMGTPANAFSVFSTQRRADAPPDEIGPHAYRTENALFMAHGRFYLELIGTQASAALQAALGALARGFVDAQGGPPPSPVPGADRFPADGLRDGSLQLITANAFGFEGLDQVFTAGYLIDGTRLTAFVSDRQTAEAAADSAARHREALLTYGAAIVDAPLPIEGAVVLQMFDTYEIIFSRGGYLAGVHEAADLHKAGVLAARLAAHLEGVARN